MLTKDNDTVRERKIYVLYMCTIYVVYNLYTSDSITWIPCPKIDKFLYFYLPSPFQRDIIFKESLTDCTYWNKL